MSHRRFLNRLKNSYPSGKYCLSESPVLQKPGLFNVLKSLGTLSNLGWNLSQYVSKFQSFPTKPYQKTYQSEATRNLGKTSTSGHLAVKWWETFRNMRMCAHPIQLVKWSLAKVLKDCNSKEAWSWSIWHQKYIQDYSCTHMAGVIRRVISLNILSESPVGHSIWNFVESLGEPIHRHHDKFVAHMPNQTPNR
jgi:hypothetical protein